MTVAQRMSLRERGQGGEYPHYRVFLLVSHIILRSARAAESIKERK